MGLFSWLNQQKRIADLEETCCKLERLVTARDMDWGDLKARCKRLLDRDEKAVRYLQQQSTESETSSATSNGEPAATTIGGPGLSPHQREVQQKILRRRAGIT